MDSVLEVIRKICLAANWVIIGLGGIVFAGAGLFFEGTQDQFNLIFGIVLIILAFIIHRITNWIFY